MKRFVACVAIIPLVVWVSACEAEDAANPTTASLAVRSSSFPPGGPIPRKYTKEGEDVSPALEWTGAPSGAKAFAVIMDDPDAPLPNPFVHWVAYGIAADTHALPEAAKTGFVAGKNHFGALGYGGPMPPPGSGPHHYHFKVYALDAGIDAAPGKSKGELLHAMEGHVLATGEVVGTYER